MPHELNKTFVLSSPVVAIRKRVTSSGAIVIDEYRDTWVESVGRHVFTGDSSDRTTAKPYRLSSKRCDGLPVLNFNMRRWWRNGLGELHTETTVVSGTARPRGFAVVNLIPPLQQSKHLLINGAISRLREESIDLATFMAELNETASYIGSAARKIASAASDVRRGRFSKAAQSLGVAKPKGVSRSKQWAQNMLEYNYAIMPVVNDALGAAEHLAKRALRLNVTATSRFYTDKSFSSTIVDKLFSPNIEDELSLRSINNGTIRTQEQVVIEYKLKDAFWREMSSLGLTNLPRTAWNLVPYSFVVDQFTNIGDFLGNLDFGLGMEFVTASYSQGQFYKGSCTQTIYNSRPAAGGGPIPFYYSSSSIPTITPINICDWERVPLAEGDIVTTLVLRSPLSVSNCLNDVALLRQRF